jgi:UPF0755 protein
MNLTMRHKIIAVCTALAVLLAVCAVSYYRSVVHVSRSCWVKMPQGSTRQALADSLTLKLGASTSAKIMRFYGLIASDTTTIYGAYQISPGDACRRVATRLAHHRQNPVKLTFNNIRTLPQLAERVGAVMEMTPDEFLAACGRVLSAQNFAEEEYVAAFLPDTYEFYWNTSADVTVSKLLDYRNKFWTEDRRAKAAALGITPVQAATLASIAEEESSKRDERGVIARLYLNRLHRGMKLQADPTVKFAVGDFALQRILSGHLRTDSPYNTYLNPGLPPGPIRIPEKATIDALLNSEPHNYIYMCAKEDFSGRHNFSTDYATHQKNAERYRRALDQRNIH